MHFMLFAIPVHNSCSVINFNCPPVTTNWCLSCISPDMSQWHTTYIHVWILTLTQRPIAWSLVCDYFGLLSEDLVKIKIFWVRTPDLHTLIMLHCIAQKGHVLQVHCIPCHLVLESFTEQKPVLSKNILCPTCSYCCSHIGGRSRIGPGHLYDSWL